MTDSDSMRDVELSRQPAVDAGAVRRVFARAASHYDHVSQVIDEIDARLLEHLDPIRLDPARVLDAGAGTGRSCLHLAKRYRGAQIYALDPAFPMLERARSKAPRWFSRQRFLCGQAEALPIRTACVQLLYSNLMLPWCCDPDAVLGEFARVLAPNGLLLLSSAGPDTFTELRECLDPADHDNAPYGLVDMHDIGDALVRAGLRDVVMETERLTVQYPDVEAILRDLKGVGAVNVTRRRMRGLAGRGRYRRLRERYERLRHAGQLPVTCELVYAHAWKGSPPGASGGVEVAPPTVR